jgi:hypothetical protein
MCDSEKIFFVIKIKICFLFKLNNQRRALLLQLEATFHIYSVFESFHQ